MGFDLREYAKNRSKNSNNSNNRNTSETPSASAGGFSLVDYALDKKREQLKREREERIRTTYATPFMPLNVGEFYEKEVVPTVTALERIASEKERAKAYSDTSDKLRGYTTLPEAPIGMPNIPNDPAKKLIAQAQEVANQREKGIRSALGGRNEFGSYVAGSTDVDYTALAKKTNIPEEELQRYAAENRKGAYREAYETLSRADRADINSFIHDSKRFNLTEDEARGIFATYQNSDLKKMLAASDGSNQDEIVKYIDGQIRDTGVGARYGYGPEAVYRWTPDYALAVLENTSAPAEGYTKENIMRYKARAIALTSIDPSSNKKWEKEAEDMYDVLFNNFFSVDEDLLKTGDGWGRIAADIRTVTHPTAEAIMLGLSKGIGAESVATLINSDVKEQSDRAFAKAAALSPTAAEISSTAGSVALYTALAYVSGGAAGSIGGAAGSLLNIPAASSGLRLATSALSGAMALGGMSAVQNLGGYVTGDISLGEYGKRIGEAEVTGAASALASGLVSLRFDKALTGKLKSEIGTKAGVNYTTAVPDNAYDVLYGGNRMPLVASVKNPQTPFYIFTRNMASGLAGTGAYIAANAAVADEKQSEEEMARQLIFGFVTSLLHSFISAHSFSAGQREYARSIEGKIAEINKSIDSFKGAAANTEARGYDLSEAASKLVLEIERLRRGLVENFIASDPNTLNDLAVTDYYLVALQETLGEYVKIGTYGASEAYMTGLPEASAVAPITDLVAYSMESGINDGAIGATEAAETNGEYTPGVAAAASEPAGVIKFAGDLTEGEYRDLLGKVKSGELVAGSYIPMRRNTPQIFIDEVEKHSEGAIKVPNVPMAGNVGHLQQNMEDADTDSFDDKRPHGFSEDDMVTIIRKMDDPQYIVLQNNGRYAEVVSFYNSRNKKVVVSVDIAGEDKNSKNADYMNGYNGGYYNIIVTEFEPDSLDDYLKKNTIIYNKTNGSHRGGSGRIVAVARDASPFANDSITQALGKSQEAGEKTSAVSDKKQGWMGLAEKYGPEGAKALADLYDEELSADKLGAVARDFSAYYNAGRDGTNLLDVTPSGKGETLRVLGGDTEALTRMEVAAYEAGRKDAAAAAKNNISGGIDDGKTGAIRVSERAERKTLQSADEQGGTVRGKQSEDLARRKNNDGRGTRAEGRGSAGAPEKARGQKVSAKALGIPTGTDDQNLVITTKADSWGYKHLSRFGVEYTSVAGEIKVNDGEKTFGVGGVQWSEGGEYKVVTRSDSSDFTEEQFARHEQAHFEIQSGKVDIAELSGRVIDIAGGDDEVRELLRAYYDDYGDTYNAAGIIEELIADAKADMDRYGVRGAKKAMDTLRRAFGKAYEQSRGAAATGGDGVAFSRSEDYRNYSKPITAEDVQKLRSIGRKSVNDFTSEDRQKAQKWAYKLYQEIGTKSPFFRAWFGDWRAHDGGRLSIVDTVGDTRSPQHNADTGWVINASKFVHKETSHHSGVSERNAVEYLPYIDDITRKAVLLETSVSDNHNPNSIMFHTMYAYTEALGHPALLRLRVEELYSEGHGNKDIFKRDYILQSVNEESLSSRNRVSNSNHGKMPSSLKSISDLYALVKTFDKDFHPGMQANPAMLNEDGTPKVMYHGTDAEFTVFDRSKGRSSMDIQGMFFSPWELDAEGYGPNVGAYYLSLKNPAPEGVAYKALNMFKGQNDAGVKAREYLEKLGYDGVNNGDEEYIAFYPSQVKSATDNIGTFDGANPDIRYSRSVNEDLSAEVADLMRQLKEKNEQLARAKGQLKRTTVPTVRSDDVGKVARDIIKRYGSKASSKDVAAQMEDLANLLVRGGDEKGDATFERIKESAAEIMSGIIYQSDSVYDPDEVELRKTIKDAIRSTPLYVSKYEKSDIALSGAYDSYNEFRKRNIGKLKTTNDPRALHVDVFYQEMCERFPWVFDPEITSQAEQLNELIRVADAPMNPTYNVAEEAEAEANELIFRLIEEVRQAQTYADRVAKREALAVAHELNKNAVLKEKLAAAREATKEKQREKNELRRQKNRVIENMKVEQRLKAEQQRDATLRREAEERLYRLVKNLDKSKLSAVNREYFKEHFGDINTLSIDPTGQRLARIADLEAEYKALVENENDFLRSPSLEALFDQANKEKVIADMSDEELYNYIYCAIELQDLQREQNRMRRIADRTDVRMQAFNVIADVDFTSGRRDNAIGRLTDGMIRDVLGAVNLIRRYTGYNDGDPLYQRALELAAGERAADKYAVDAEAAFKPLLDNKKMTRVFSGKNAAEIEITARSVRAGDKPVKLKITPALRAALYMHLQNDDNMRHAAIGGIYIPDVEKLKAGKISEAYSEGTLVRFEKSELKRITAGMSDFEKQFAAKAGQYFGLTSAQALTDTYEALHGVPPKMIGKGYFPINVVGTATGGEVSAETLLASYESGNGDIMNPGWMKERAASKMPILLVPIDTVVNRAIQNHARYVGLAVPLQNFRKLWTASIWERSSRYNAMAKADETSRTPVVSVREAISEKWGPKAASAIDSFVSQISGAERRTNATVFGKMRSRYAGAVLELSLSTALKQTPSGIAAAYITGWGPLMKAATPGLKADTSFIDEMTAAYTIRKKGYSSQELGELASTRGKLPPALSWIITADLATTSLLKRAAVFYVRDNFKTLSVGSEAFRQKAVEIYEQIISETQPTYDVMYRASALRSNSEIKRALHMFKTQPYKNFGIVYTALENLAAKRRAYFEANKYAADSDEGRAYIEEARKAYKDAKKGVSRAITSQIVSGLAISLIMSAWDMFIGNKKKYKDEDGEITFLSFLKGLGINFLSTGAGAFPFGGAVLETLEVITDQITNSNFFGTSFYGFDVPEVEMLNNFIKSGTNLIEVITSGDADAEKLIREFWKALNETAQFMGVPLKNITKLAKGVAQNLFRTKGKYVGEFYALRVSGEVSDNKKAHYDNLYNAYEHNQAQYKEVYDLLIKNGITPEAIRNAMNERIKNAQGAQSVNELSSSDRYLNPDQQDDYNKMLSQVESTDVYKRYEAQVGDDLGAYSRLIDLAYDVTDGKKRNTWQDYAIVKEYGLTKTEYVLYQLALDIVDEPNKDGKYGTYTDKEKAAAVKIAKGN